MNYPAAVDKFLDPNCEFYPDRASAAKAYKARTGKELPAYTTAKPVQPWMDLRPNPPDKDSIYEGYAYDFIGVDSRGYWHVEEDSIPYSQASVPNIAESWVQTLGPHDYPMPLRKFGKTPSGGFEVLASSAFGLGVIDSAHMENRGMLTVPPEVLEAINNGTYVPPGV